MVTSTQMNNPALRGKVAIVTGAGRGIGREIATTLAYNGAYVVLVSRTSTELDGVAQAICSEGNTALALPADVTDADAVGRFVDETVKRLGGVDILVNAAGANYVSNLMLSNDDSWKRTFEVNVYGVYLCTKHVLRHMIRKKEGRIINISSVAGKIGVPYGSSYCASKAAVLGFTRSVALEVARLGITVNAICPWHVDTELMRTAMAARASVVGKNVEEQIADIVNSNPQRRLITSAEVAALALFLISPQAAGINGQALNQCGGAVSC